MEKVDRPAFMEKAVVWPKGNTIDDFEVGRVFEHHWAVQLTQATTVSSPR